MVADADSWRVQNGKKSLGYLNATIYDPAQVQGVFRDVIDGTATSYAAATSQTRRRR
jgi:hypothetical protein